MMKCSGDRLPEADSIRNEPSAGFEDWQPGVCSVGAKPLQEMQKNNALDGTRVEGNPVLGN